MDPFSTSSILLPTLSTDFSITSIFIRILALSASSTVKGSTWMLISSRQCLVMQKSKRAWLSPIGLGNCSRRINALQSAGFWFVYLCSWWRIEDPDKSERVDRSLAEGEMIARAQEAGVNARHPGTDWGWNLIKLC
jgi:hypothetical protein